ncbi:hypothetical protein L6452_32860 [Arctium lappa]|uniref:Uncharacterized protein n=1 Tax=Arctium lappa TaxID=4217 RepID=A0ACB8Z5I0_ARCLA|nr:hypothetical protein L6452_32860 [Arctium lappa]
MGVDVFFPMNKSRWLNREGEVVPGDGRPEMASNVFGDARIFMGTSSEIERRSPIFLGAVAGQIDDHCGVPAMQMSASYNAILWFLVFSAWSCCNLSVVVPSCVRVCP